MITQAVRGAVQIPGDNREDIRKGVAEVLKKLLEENRLTPEDLVSIQFTVTGDLVSLNPAAALRTGGYGEVPLFCAREPEYPDSLPRMIRVLLTFQVPEKIRAVPVYLDGAEKLRPDLFS